VLGIGKIPAKRILLRFMSGSTHGGLPPATYSLVCPKNQGDNTDLSVVLKTGFR
jgi:hypothetical protein